MNRKEFLQARGSRSGAAKSRQKWRIVTVIPVFRGVVPAVLALLVTASSLPAQGTPSPEPIGVPGRAGHVPPVPAPTGPAPGDPPTVLNATDFCGSAQPYDIAIQESRGLIYVTEIIPDGTACVFDLLLNPMGSLPQPIGDIAGLAWNAADDLLYWNDYAAEILWVTDAGGNIVDSFPFESPDGGVLLNLTFDQLSGTLWAGDFDTAAYYEFTDTGTPTGNSLVPSCAPHVGTGTGITWRSDNGDFELVVGSTNPFSPPAAVCKVGVDGAETGGQRIDVSPTFFDFALGVAFHPTGSTGVPALYVTDAQGPGPLGFRIYEIEAIPKTVGPEFVRADVNVDGTTDLSDAILLLNSLFSAATLDCERAADVNRDCIVDISDAIYLLGFLFAGGPEPTPPFPGCGSDTACSGLSCASFSGCP